MKKRYCYLISLMLVLLDQASKAWVIQVLTPYDAWPIVQSLNFTLVFNTGSAFGFLNSSGEWHKWFFAGFSVLMSGLLSVWLWRTKRQDKLQALALCFILGGAMGNFLDRMLHGYVIDFIDFYYKTHHFAIFNLADSAIFVGAVLLFFDFLKPRPQNIVV